jgi:hypothetical protein
MKGLFGKDNMLLEALPKNFSLFSSHWQWSWAEANKILA